MARPRITRRLLADPIAAAPTLREVLCVLRAEDGRPPPRAEDLELAAHRWVAILVGRGVLEERSAPAFMAAFCGPGVREGLAAATARLAC